MAKERLDVLLVERGLAASRERARTMIMEGRVLVDGKKVEKAGTGVKPEAELRLLGEEMPYVSRGGLKLEKALRAFSLDLRGCRMIDIGASTGGFTDCALQNGAAEVVAVDVGYGQLAWKLRTDKRVVNMERTNIRHVTPADTGGPADFISVDVSFISLLKIMEAVVPLLREGGSIVTLIKPQFEAGREAVGKGGIVRDIRVHKEVAARVVAGVAAAGLSPSGLTFSPVKGADGNVEYLLYSRKDTPVHNEVTDEIISDVVDRSHEM